MIRLADERRPRWLSENTVHDGFCSGCTMPGFHHAFMPFMDSPPGSLVSSTAVRLYGKPIRALRHVTRRKLNHEPAWRHPRGDGLDAWNGWLSAQRAAA